MKIFDDKRDLDRHMVSRHPEFVSDELKAKYKPKPAKKEACKYCGELKSKHNMRRHEREKHGVDGARKDA